MEWEWYPLDGWKFFGNYYGIKGKSVQSGMPINDIPPVRLYLGMKYRRGRLTFEMDSKIQAKKNNPGPAEITIPAYGILNLSAGYYLQSRLHIYCCVSNILNKAYIPRPDPDAMEAPGRNFVIGIHYFF
jgi:outer membrane receptor protein involved in Fe transport